MPLAMSKETAKESLFVVAPSYRVQKFCQEPPRVEQTKGRGDSCCGCDPPQWSQTYAQAVITLDLVSEPECANDSKFSKRWVSLPLRT